VHVFPHDPQWVVLLDRLASQPLPRSPSQSSKPPLHTNSHLPSAQPTVAFGTAAQRFPHPPQWFESTSVSTHEPAHMVVPIEHTDVHTAGLRVPSHIKPAPHALRQLPQLLVVVTNISQPMLGSLSQSR
jgi:hypothetical protein